MTRITVILTDQELAALRKQAEHDLRGLREQARYLIRRGLLFMPPDPASVRPADTAPEVSHDRAPA